MGKLKHGIDGPYALVFILASIALFFVFIFLLFGKKIAPLIEPSVFRLTYQFLLLLVLGGAVSFLFKELSQKKLQKEEELLRSEEKRRLNSERLREIHSDLLEAYNKAKTVRRMLQAYVYSADDGVEMILRDDFDRQIKELNRAQLVFETYKKRAESNNLWFEQVKNLSNKFDAIESYLNKILSEYQKKRRLFTGAPLSYPLRNLDRLNEFLGPKDNWKWFRDEFKKPMGEILESLDKAQLLMLNEPNQSVSTYNTEPRSNQ